MRQPLIPAALILALPALTAVESTTITGVVRLRTGSVVTSGSVTATLSSVGAAPDWASFSVVPSRVTTPIASDGTVSIALVPNDVIMPANTYYTLEFKATAPTSSIWTKNCLVTTNPDPVPLGGLMCVETTQGIATPTSKIMDDAANRTWRTDLEFTGAGIACADDARQSRTDCVIPGERKIHVQHFATGGSGTSVDPWTGWEAAFDGIGVAGAEIDFAAGHYREKTAVTLPVNLTGWLFVKGNGATIHLTEAAPRFLTPNVTADYQTVRRIRIQEFEVDATLATGQNNVIFGDYVNGSALNGFKRVNWDQIVVKKIRAYGLTVDNTTTTHLGGINLSAIQAGDAEATANTITNIDIEDVRIEGGNWGILIDGGGPGIHTNVSIDNVWLVRCWHSLMARPSKIFPSSNFQVGERGKVGHVYVIDCFGQYAADSGLELNNVAYGLVTGTEIDDALVGGFYYTNYTVPSGTPHVTWDHCRAAVTGSLGSSAFGSGWYIPAGSGGIPPGGAFVVSNSTYTRSAVTIAKFGAALAMIGAHGSLTLVNDDFSWLNANVDLGSARLMHLVPSDDFRLAVRGAKLTMIGTRSGDDNGLNLIALTESGAFKRISVDVDGVRGSAAIIGTSVDSTIVSASFSGSTTSTITGSFSDSRFSSASGDPAARGVKIDMANLRVDGSLDFIALDGSELPAGGRTVVLDNPPSLSEEAKAQMVGVIEPSSPGKPVFSGDRVCTAGPTPFRLKGCFTPVDVVSSRTTTLPDLTGRVVVGGGSQMTPVPAWAPATVSCATACANVGQLNCAYAVLLGGTKPQLASCTTTFGLRLCECD